ncbi:MAG TPA: hypothetical protein VJ969_05370 [Desulfopila sp.]|nr:hypothetical protein [Desulfopila sp.]
MKEQPLQGPQPSREQEEHREKFQQSFELYRTIAGAAGKALILTDEQGLVLVAAPKAALKLKLLAADVEGKPIASLFSSRPSIKPKEPPAVLFSTEHPTIYDIVGVLLVNGFKLTAQVRPLMREQSDFPEKPFSATARVAKVQALQAGQ